MAINTSTPYNKNYCTLTGTYSGTTDMQYEIKITDGNGTEFKWRISNTSTMISYCCLT